MRIKTYLIASFILIGISMSMGAQAYEVSYPPSAVSMVISLTMQPETHKTYNISIVASVNDTMTVIIQTFGDSGPLWGFFIIPRNEYQNNFTVDDLGSYQKYADHANYYSVVQILQNPGLYVLAFYDTLGHPASSTTFNATFLNGIYGTQTKIINPAIFNEAYLQLVAVGLIVIALVEIVLIIHKKRSA